MKQLLESATCLNSENDHQAVGRIYSEQVGLNYIVYVLEQVNYFTTKLIISSFKGMHPSFFYIHILLHRISQKLEKYITGGFRPHTQKQ